MFDSNIFLQNEKLFEAIPLRNCLRNIQMEMQDMLDEGIAEEKAQIMFKKYVEQIEVALRESEMISSGKLKEVTDENSQS